MKLQLDEHYHVEADATAWTLVCVKPTIDANTGQQCVSEKTGEPTFSTKQWYHGQLQYALMQYVDEGLKGSTVAANLLTRLERLETNVINACKGVSKINET